MSKKKKYEKPKGSYFAIYGIPNVKNFHKRCLLRLKLPEEERIISEIKSSLSGKINLSKTLGENSEFKEFFGKDIVLWEYVKKFSSQNKGNSNIYIVRFKVLDDYKFDKNQCRNYIDGLCKPNIVHSLHYDFE